MNKWSLAPFLSYFSLLCQLNDKGRQAFVEYIDDLEKIIKNVPGMKKKYNNK
jgi:hypothetical protein